MNSHQRRKERREWKYIIDAPSRDWYHYMEMFEWCQKNFGVTVADGWQDPRWVGIPEWKFNCPKKAAVFAMRWQ
jgi:hypothetical protein